MDIQFVDTKIQTVDIRSIKIGDTFIPSDGTGDICMNVGLDTTNGDYQYIILGECPEVCYVKGTFQVRPVKSKLIVEI